MFCVLQEFCHLCRLEIHHLLYSGADVFWLGFDVEFHCRDTEFVSILELFRGNFTPVGWR